MPLFQSLLWQCYLLIFSHKIFALVDKSSIEKTHGQSFRVKPLVDVLTHTVQEHYSPGKVLSLDESMVKNKGSGRGKVKTPNKHTRKDLKFGFAQVPKQVIVYISDI